MIDKAKITKGRRIIWQRVIGRRSEVRERSGIFLGFVRHTAKYWQRHGRRQQVNILCDGDIRPRMVPMVEVFPIKEDKTN